MQQGAYKLFKKGREKKAEVTRGAEQWVVGLRRRVLGLVGGWTLEWKGSEEGFWALCPESKRPRQWPERSWRGSHTEIHSHQPNRLLPCVNQLVLDQL